MKSWILNAIIISLTLSHLPMKSYLGVTLQSYF